MTAASVVSLWRYPVKSMQGEEVNIAEFTERGVLGDRSYALTDSSDGRIASAKNPRKWGALFSCHAALTDNPRISANMPPARITLPDGRVVMTDDEDIDVVMGQTLGRDVVMTATAPTNPSLEEYWPDIEGLAYREVITDEEMPSGTFFDLAVVHILTTATIDRLREIYPEGRFETRRFRPNIVIAPENGPVGFVENAWIGQTLCIGDDVQLRVTGACPRCVMTTLPQSDLPRDPGILRTAAQHNNASVGVYASVTRGGTVRRGDTIQVV